MMNLIIKVMMTYLVFGENKKGRDLNLYPLSCIKLFIVLYVFNEFLESFFNVLHYFRWNVF